MIQLAVSSADIGQADNALQFLSPGDPGDQIRRLHQQLRPEMNGFAPREYSHLEDLGFHEILENMASVGQFGIVARTGFRHLTNGIKAADVGKGSRDTQFRR